MEKIIKLTEEDIAQIIAEHFHVDRTKVFLTTNINARIGDAKVMDEIKEKAKPDFLKIIGEENL